MSETTGDYEYDLTHEVPADAPAPPGTTRPVQVATETDDQDQDLSYDLAHDVPR
jgi:hypothetical protein